MRATGVALMVLWSATSCRAVAGVEDRSGDRLGGDAQAQPATTEELVGWLGTECAACATQQCAERFDACASNTECVALTACRRSAPDPGGWSACAAEHVPGVDAFSGGGSCLRQSCTEACGAGAHWACVGDTWGWPPPPARELEATIVLEEVGTTARIPGATVKACRNLDPTCTTGEQARGVTDSEGTVVLSLPTLLASVRVPWDGYFDVSGPGLHPDLRYLGTPLSVDGDASLGTLTEAVFELQSTGLDVDPAMGVITVDALDCLFFFAPGVSIEVEPASPRTFYAYLRDGLTVDTTLTATTRDAVGIAVNVPPGTITVTGRLAATGRVIARREVFVRPGARTALFMPPSSG